VGERGETALVLTMTARGPCGKEAGLDWKAGLDLGHEAIIRAFLGLTSDTAHKAWELKT
jgi:hypothetical protein